MNLVILYLLTFVVFFVIDLLWLGIVAKNLYKKYIGFIMADRPNWVAAIVFYLIFIFGLVYFVIYPGTEDGTLLSVAMNGMIMGFVTYATYDLTNLATLNRWPITITIIDLIWGTVLGGSVSFISFLFYNFIY